MVWLSTKISQIGQTSLTATVELLQLSHKLRLKPEYIRLHNVYGIESLWMNQLAEKQVEGLFNKLDLKTHPNMMQDLKQSKLRLSFGDIDEKNIALGLSKVRTNRKKQSAGLVQD
ncbi:11911_t:CDS:2, partial [Racocetra persica]